MSKNPPFHVPSPASTASHPAQPRHQTIELHQHPFVGKFIEQLVHRDSIEDLLNFATQLPTQALFNGDGYHANSSASGPLPIYDVDFSRSGAYSAYNWEIFFHIPLAIAVHLSQNQRYQDAQRWFHYIFDPTDDSDGPIPDRFWKVKPFRGSDVKLAEQVLTNLSTRADPKLHDDTVNAIEECMREPFRPFLVGRFRQTAFMMKTVMAYLDNLIAWGDSLFSQYTGETIAEAAQIYVLAAHILGRRPQEVPKKEKVKPHTYASLQREIDEFGNALVQVESELPMNVAPPPRSSPPNRKFGTVLGIGRTMYFCTPRNPKLLGYWDTVGDRLYKIRNSLNIQGVFQQVPLFDPPIDPALLVRGAAAGLDVAAVAAGAGQPLPIVRFNYLAQKASEACQEVKSLGANLLAAMEKKDNEALSVLRAQHETALLKLAEAVKYSAFQEATKNREGIEQSIRNAIARYTYYERLLGKKQSEIPIPTIEDLDKAALGDKKLSTKEPTIQPREIDVDVADVSMTGGLPISTPEAAELGLLTAAHVVQQGVQVAQGIAKVLALIPDPKLAVHFWGIGADLDLPGGRVLSTITSFAADMVAAAASEINFAASMTAKAGGYANRKRDYEFQSNTVAGEINQLFKQFRASQIREAMAELEWKNHQKQIEHAQEIEAFLSDDVKGKQTNVAFYAWMKREVKGLYAQCFQFAFDIARKAERSMQEELGRPDLSFIQCGYLAGKEGLLAGEKLYFDVKRMEMAYAEQNHREYELTKHVSLLQVSPTALLQLRTTGACTFKLTEDLFDFDCPGHYFRRIKTVALSLPSVTGPYSSVNCRLSLQKSTIRKTAVLGDSGYARDETQDDPRFSDYFGAGQSIVTSGAQNDTGLFETNLHDERRLPFEGCGVLSEWRLELPKELRQFDYETIADLILHMRYTAREGGDALRKAAVEQVQSMIGEATAAGCVRLFDVRREFPTEWAKFKAVNAGHGGVPTATLSFTLTPEHYPFWSRGRIADVQKVVLIAKSEKEVVVVENVDGSGKQDVLAKDERMAGLRAATLRSVTLPAGAGGVTLRFRDNFLTDLWIAIARRNTI